MRLPHHKMGKIIQKHGRTAKHKDSAASKAKKEKKEAKANSMDTDSVIDAAPISEAEKEAAKAARKKENAHKMLYKKNNYNITSRNGPRTVAE